jgi:hypothetical protein
MEKVKLEIESCPVVSFNYDDLAHIPPLGKFIADFLIKHPGITGLNYSSLSHWGMFE